MSKRTILTGIGTYVGTRGDEPVVGQIGYQGEEVDVHEDYLEEFDRVNVANGTGEPIEYERIGVNMISPVAAAKAAPKEEDEEDKSTAKKAPAKKV
jgi:hypothetical protein